MFGALGAARDCLETALDYAQTREVFDKPLAGVPAHPGEAGQHDRRARQGQLLALHLGRLKDEGRMRPEQVSLGKLNNVREALDDRARVPRRSWAANGITLEYPVIRHMNNLESVSPTRAPPRCTRWSSARPSRASRRSADER